MPASPRANVPIATIAALLESDAHERQIAAAIVLGELGAREPAVVDALAAAVMRGIPPVQRHALDALGRLASGAAAKRAIPAVMAALGARDEAVRAAAVEAAVALGDAVTEAVRVRLADATDAGERRALEAVLGRAGGPGPFQALLDALETPDLEAARAAALAVRQRARDATPRERASMLAQVTKLLKARASAARKPGAALGAVTGGLKILGYLEDPAALPTLLAFARDGKQPAVVRQEAIVALRFAARGKPGAAAAALAEIAERGAPELARAALYSLASLPLPPALAPRLQKIALGSEGERALLALERLAQIPGEAGGKGLAAVLVATGDRARAEAAAAALGSRPDGALALARALIDVADPERAVLLARLLRPRARELAAAGPAGRKLARALIDTAVARAAEGQTAGHEALLPLAREIDRAATADALRAAAQKAHKARRAEQALGLLRAVGRSPDATAEDGYALAVAELRGGRRDEALAICAQLVAGGFDLAAAIRRDRLLAPEQRYQIGFALVERRQAGGEEILSDLAADGRSKVARMARAKLKSAGYA
ncbi:MAG TPA: hypothetical protein VN962_20280 [Polyangia bacterium]|nr:hypothetical protein [Polyangia bacterium]